MESIYIVALLTIPVLSALAVFICTGWRRWVAVVALLVTGPAFAIDLYSAANGGNLTGLLTLLTAPVGAILVLAVLGAECVARWRPGSVSGGLKNAEPLQETLIKGNKAP